MSSLAEALRVDASTATRSVDRLDRRRATMEAILAPFSADERTVLAELLERLIAGVDRVAGDTSATSALLAAETGREARTSATRNRTTPSI
jgi:hypothetical protein